MEGAELAGGGEGALEGLEDMGVEGVRALG